jgi:hypothetical protein
VPILVAERFKTRICSLLLAEIAGSNSAGVWMSILFVVSCQVEVSASGPLPCKEESYGMSRDVVHGLGTSRMSRL